MEATSGICVGWGPGITGHEALLPPVAALGSFPHKLGRGRQEAMMDIDDLSFLVDGIFS